MNKLFSALSLAIESHKTQTRLIGGQKISYVCHPLEVYNLLVDLGETNEDTLCAALLHDSVEDADDRLVAAWRVREIGRKIWDIVEELTLPISAVTNDNREEKLRIKYGHIGNTLTNGSIAAKKIKLADRICNVLDFWSSGKKEKAEEYYGMFKAVMPKDLGGDGVLEELVDMFAAAGKKMI
jgi:(p)ppGpp synthase/HD superfamily hydrolase